MMLYKTPWFRHTLCRWIANHLPRWVVYHALIQGWANATNDKYSSENAETVTTADMISRWEF